MLSLTTWRMITYIFEDKRWKYFCLQLIAVQICYLKIIPLFTMLIFSDTFDWFQPHENDFCKSELHKAMLSLSSNHNFLPNLLSNRVSSYPGGSFRSLQILAFWLSWVRAMYTENQQLHLSKALLYELKMWYIDTTLVVQDGTGSDGPQSIDKPEEEINLAKTLYDDFFNSQQQHRSESEGDQATSSTADNSELFVSGFSTLSLTHAPAVSSSQTLTGSGCSNSPELSTLSIQSISALKEQENVAFRAKNYNEALSLYTKSIDDISVLKDSADLVTIPPTTSAAGSPLPQSDGQELVIIEMSLHMNAATALWHLATDATTTSIHQGGDEVVTAFLQRCAEHSRIVLKADPMYYTHTHTLKLRF